MRRIQTAVCEFSGEVGCILAHDPDTTVWVDVAVFADEVIQAQTNETSLVDGIPVLAVEILSPSDRHDEVHEKIREYLRVGVVIVWEVDPDFKTIRVHRSDAEPVMFNREQTIDTEGVLPGFSVAVEEFFPR